jgi:alpha-amylase/alpha-mannosidase (GH57 family)
MKQLRLVFLWHMHQPDYRNHDGGMIKASAGEQDVQSRHRVGDDGMVAGEFTLPWVYLHAMKDYADMAAHLERYPEIRCVVNFVPVLLEQIEDYAQQFASGQFRDPLLRLLAAPDLNQITATERQLLLNTCFRSNHVTMLAPFPRYQHLHNLYLDLCREGEATLSYLSGAYFSDLVTWYHLAWTGETERRHNPLIAALMSKGEGYDATDRQRLLASIGALIGGLIPRWRALAARGQVELSTTPQTHPLAPLLLDFHAARESQPDAQLPISTIYPGGRNRVVSQIEDARTSHATRFGAPPVGMWPAEGAISAPFAQLLADAGCRWIASGEGVLKHSLAASGIQTTARATYRPWRLESAPGMTLFFRDERLSDLIGFDYAKWHGRDASLHLIAQLEAILDAAPAAEEPIISIILDGENAWEHYPYNAYYFFDDLYKLLKAHPRIRTTTYADLLAQAPPIATSPLPQLVAGTLVYGTLSTRIGDKQKNHALDLLCAAKQSYDLVLTSGRLSPEKSALATRQLAVCESSDWFWWFGDYNPATSVASFDQLFRHNLTRLYHLLELEPPAQLEMPISAGSSTASGGSMRRATESSA